MILNISSYKDKMLTKEDYTIEDDSLLTYGFDCLRESDIEIRKIVSESYSNGEVVLKEGILRSFMDIIKSIIVSFIRVISKLFDRFILVIKELFNSKDIIFEYKDKLRKMNKEFEVLQTEINWIQYRNFEKDVPDPSLYLRFSAEYEDSIREIQNSSKLKDRADVTIAIQRLSEKVITDPNDKFFNSLRSEICGEKNIVNQNDYPDYLYRLFREHKRDINPKKVEKVKITPAMVKEAVNRFCDHDKLVKTTNKQKATLINAADTVISRLEKLSPDEFIKNYTDIDYELQYSYETYGRKKAGQLAEMCNICVMAYSAKLDAIKSAYIQDKKVCYLAIGHIIGGEI